ncbi:hypothetical protein, partial [Staphylococcus hominis]|uniref:hypothetical protein n=1 Tax=Staphylococcus hominis TaxID=1290 RepID=UPI003709593E
MGVIIGKEESEIRNELLESKDKGIASSEFLTGRVDRELKDLNGRVKGWGKNGKMFMDDGGEEI